MRVHPWELLYSEPVTPASINNFPVHSTMSDPSSSSTASQKPSPLTEVLNNWKTAVLLENDNDNIHGGTNKSNHQDLQQDAQIFFRYISSNTQIDAGSGVILKTRSSHEEALARLIQELGPAFSGRAHPHRLRGLQVLLGALEGCRDSHISNGCFQLLGDFLLVQCGPIADDDEYEEDYDSLIRDTCVKALSALSETSAIATGSIEEYVQALERRCHFSARGVERRCAAPEDEMTTTIDPYGSDVPMPQDIRGGLSTLARSKRSLCFDLLRSAVSGISKINYQMESSENKIEKTSTQLMAKVQRSLAQFTEFSTRCIPGESDPRCLMQLLELLHAIQVTFQIWFQTVESANNVFPNEDVFEAVVPYYPIQFTPPPNNIHGITREGLHSELMAVLTCTKMDEAARKHRKPTMLSCSAGLLLEQLLPGPPDDDMPLTSLEKLEALNCLSTLLFPGESNETSRAQSECRNLTVNEVRSLSEAIRVTHDDASLAAGRAGSPEDPNKVLANACRDLVAKVASELEKSNSNDLWRAFVLEPLDKELKKLQLSPARATTTIAYEACLCASGAPKTLRACLSMGLEPLLDFVKDNLEDSEDSLAAVHGMAAFFSSSNVAMSKNCEVGVELTPHPMEAYAKKACDLFLKVVERDGASTSSSHKTAVITALECLFQAATSRQLESDDIVARICNFIQGLLRSVTIKDDDDGSSEHLKFVTTSSRVLGNIIGVSMISTDETEKSDLILSSDKIQDYVKSDIFVALKESVFQGSADTPADRPDRQAMATACSANFELASTIVGAHVEAFRDALSNSLTDAATFSKLEALSFLIQNSNGDNVVRAFHDTLAVDDILDTLGSKLMAGTSARLRDSISQIALPATTEEQSDLTTKVCKA
jgi:Dos2-interacting transcription regulator of RNA-Pol-II